MHIRVITLILLLIYPLYSYSAVLNLNDIKWPPYFFPNVEGSKQQGIAKDLINICIAESQYTISYKNLPIKRTHSYMRTGELDISVYSYKPEREEFVIYGKEPIFNSEYGFASRSEDNIQIKQLADIYNFHFGHMAGLSHTPELMRIIDEKRKNEQVTEAYNLDAMFDQLLATPQRFEVMANTKETFLWKAKQLGISDKIKVHDLVVAVKPYFITVSKSSKNIKNIDQFLHQVDRCLIKLKESGKYNTIINNYGL